MKIYAARHGETEWNALGKVCGRTDLDLTEKGVAQAHALAEQAAGKGIGVLISSPMVRARHTSAIIAARCGLEILTDERLIEQAYGIYEGADRSDKGFLANKRMFAYRYPGGESMMQVAGRVYALLDEVREKYAGKNVLLVCHGGVLRVIRTYFEDMTNDEYFNYSMDNCALACYTADE